MWKKSILIYIVALMLLSGMFVGICVDEVVSSDVPVTALAGGSGTVEDPYIIENVWELQNMSLNLTAHYALGNDIDAHDTINWNSGAGFVAVGTNPNRFTGSLDGQNFTITGLHINRTGTNYQGLLGYIDSGGFVKNVGLIEVNITGRSNVGGLVGFNCDTVTNSYCTGTVSGYEYVGGLVGQNYQGTITNSYAIGTVSGTGSYYIGGLVGYSYGIVANSHATGTVNGKHRIGGLIGANYDTVNNSYAIVNVSGTGGSVGGLVGVNRDLVLNSHAMGNVIGGSIVGGLVGYNELGGCAVIDSFAIGTVTGSFNNIGGLIGENMGSVRACYATGATTGESNVGGLIGQNRGTVNKSYATGNVSGSVWYVGGLVSQNYLGTIRNSYATGTVTRSSGTNEYFGGFAARNYQGKIINCYSTGQVIYYGGSNPTNKGFVGDIFTGGNYEMTGNFWDVETSGQNSTAGNATGETTVVMKTQSTFTNVSWDFENIWWMREGITYPLFRWQPLPQVCTIELIAGWNLVSVPFEMTSTSIENVLSSISGKWDVVKWCDPTDKMDPWKSYRIGGTANDLTYIDNTMGLWLHATVACNLTVFGAEPQSTSIILYAGWNLVSFPTLNNNTTVANALWGTGANRVEVFDPASPYLISEAGPTYIMKPGEGYWVHVVADTIWTINW